MLPTNIQSYFATYGKGALPPSGTVTAGQLAAAHNGITLGLINGTKPIPASTPVFDIVNFTAPFDAGGDVPQKIPIGLCWDAWITTSATKPRCFSGPRGIATIFLTGRPSLARTPIRCGQPPSLTNHFSTR